MVLDHGDIGIYIINNREILLEDLVRKVGLAIWANGRPKTFLEVQKRLFMLDSASLTYYHGNDVRAFQLLDRNSSYVTALFAFSQDASGC